MFQIKNNRFVSFYGTNLGISEILLKTKIQNHTLIHNIMEVTYTRKNPHKQGELLAPNSLDAIALGPQIFIYIDSICCSNKKSEETSK